MRLTTGVHSYYFHDRVAVVNRLVGNLACICDRDTSCLEGLNKIYKQWYHFAYMSLYPYFILMESRFHSSENARNNPITKSLYVANRHLLESRQERFIQKHHGSLSRSHYRHTMPAERKVRAVWLSMRNGGSGVVQIPTDRIAVIADGLF